MLNKSLPYLIIVALIVFIFFKDCSNTPDPVVIKIPAVSGSFEPVKPVQVPITHEPILSKSNKSKNDKSKKPIPGYVIENDSLLKSYERENDSLKRALMFKKAIQLSSFNTKFEDENLTLNIDGIVQGEVQEITPSYVIKAKEITVKQKEVKFRLLAGLEVGNTILFNDPLFKANIGFQNAKGNIITASYDTEKRIFVGYSFTVFKIKR